MSPNGKSGVECVHTSPGRRALQVRDVQERHVFMNAHQISLVFLSNRCPGDERVEFLVSTVSSYLRSSPRYLARCSTWIKGFASGRLTETTSLQFVPLRPPTSFAGLREMLRSSRFLPTFRHVFTDGIISKSSVSVNSRSLSTFHSRAPPFITGTVLSRSRLLQRTPRQRLWQWDRTGRSRRQSTQHHPAQQPSKSKGIGERFRELSRKYGWAAVGVYLGLTVLDFPLCFLAVRWMGTERIAEAEHFVVQGFWNLLAMLGLDYRTREKEEVHMPTAGGTAAGVEAAENGQRQGEHASESSDTRQSI